MARYKSKSPLVTWLNGGESLKSFVDNSRFVHFEEYGAWVALEEVCPAHLAVGISAQSLEECWKKTQAYVEAALKIVFTAGGEAPEDLFIEHEDRGEILYELGDPPGPSLPLYIFSVCEGGLERAVYVGKTNSSKGRFSGGHRAGVKLLDPKYDNCEKRLYLCQVMFLNKSKELLPLEWLHPYETAVGLLDDAESDLIFRLQPELNEHKKTKNHSKSKIDFMIVNYSERATFLAD